MLSTRSDTDQLAPEDRLVKDLQRFYELQRRTTRYEATLIAKYGAETILKWLEVVIDEDAPTPATFLAKEKAFASSPLYAKRDDCELIY